MFIDTHAHLTSPEMLVDIDEVMARAEAAKVTRIVNVCTDEKSLDAGLALAVKYPQITNAAAATPHDVTKIKESFFERVEKEAVKGTLAAIGETGLDYYYERAPKKEQQEHFLRYIALAKRENLPLIVHCREAFNDLFSLADEHLGSHPVALHCFTGTLEEAKQVIRRGWMLSLSGIVTFKKSDWLREVAAYVPLDRLFYETDCPYLAPQKWRGKRNEPAYVVETACVIAEIKGLSVNELASAVFQNAASFFEFTA